MLLLHIKKPVIIRKQLMPVLPHIPIVHNNNVFMLNGLSTKGPHGCKVSGSLEIRPELTTQ